MTTKEINQALLIGGDCAGRAAAYILENGVVTATTKGSMGMIQYSVGKVKSEETVRYDAVGCIENIVNYLSEKGKRIYRLVSEADNDICITRIYSCKKDILQRRMRRFIQEDQASFMRMVGYQLENPVRASQKEIEDFLRVGYAEDLQRIQNGYKVVEVK